LTVWLKYSKLHPLVKEMVMSNMIDFSGRTPLQPLGEIPEGFSIVPDDTLSCEIAAKYVDQIDGGGLEYKGNAFHLLNHLTNGKEHETGCPVLNHPNLDGLIAELRKTLFAQ
jgi:hypothetical protein